MNFQDHLNGFSKMRDETRSSSSGNRSHSSRSCGNRPISHAATSRASHGGNIDQKYHDFLNGVKETNKQPTQQRRRARYATGGHVALTKNNAERLAKQGRFGDTKLAKVGTLTAKLMDGLVHGGHKQINPKTGLREYNKCPNCGGDIAKCLCKDPKFYNLQKIKKNPDKKMLLPNLELKSNKKSIIPKENSLYEKRYFTQTNQSLNKSNRILKPEFVKNISKNSNNSLVRPPSSQRRNTEHKDFTNPSNELTISPLNQLTNRLSTFNNKNLDKKNTNENIKKLINKNNKKYYEEEFIPNNHSNDSNEYISQYGAENLMSCGQASYSNMLNDFIKNNSKERPNIKKMEKISKERLEEAKNRKDNYNLPLCNPQITSNKERLDALASLEKRTNKRQKQLPIAASDVNDPQEQMKNYESILGLNNDNLNKLNNEKALQKSNSSEYGVIGLYNHRATSDIYKEYNKNNKDKVLHKDLPIDEGYHYNYIKGYEPNGYVNMVDPLYFDTNTKLSNVTSRLFYKEPRPDRELSKQEQKVKEESQNYKNLQYFKDNRGKFQEFNQGYEAAKDIDPTLFSSKMLGPREFLPQAKSTQIKAYNKSKTLNNLENRLANAHTHYNKKTDNSENSKFIKYFGNNFF